MLYLLTSNVETKHAYSWKVRGLNLKPPKQRFLSSFFWGGGGRKGYSTFRIFGIFVSERTLILPSKVSQISFKTSSNFPRSSHTHLRKNFQQLDILLQSFSTIEILEATILTNFVCSLLWKRNTSPIPLKKLYSHLDTFKLQRSLAVLFKVQSWLFTLSWNYKGKFVEVSLKLQSKVQSN